MCEMSESIDYFLPQFCCDFITNNRLEDNHCFDGKRDSYLRQKQLKWLLEKNNNYLNNWRNKSSIGLFGLDVDYNDVNSNQIKVLFTSVKKLLNELRSDSMTRSGSNRNAYNYDYRELRNKICTFLAFLRRRLFEICIQSNQINDKTMTNSENSFCILVIKQIKALLLFVGRLSQMRPQLIRLAISSEPKTSIYNYFHSCLDIWWTTIELTYILDQNNQIILNDCSIVKEDMSCSQLCSQTIRLVLFDLIVLSINRFNETKSMQRYTSLSVFDCLCIKEMFVLVRHMSSALKISDNFSELLFSTLNLFTNNLNSSETQSITDFKTICFENVLIEKPCLHFLWFVTNVVQTFNYDITGEFNQYLSADPIPSAVLKKITQLLKQNESTINECELSAIVLFCLKAVIFWRPNTDLLLPFTEFFLKNLNKRYNQISVDELQVIPKSSAKWRQMIKEISEFSDRNNSFMENSFYLYLSLMSRQLSTVFKNCEPRTKLQNWNKFKGKFMANLQPKRLERMDGTAVFNLLSFYLVLINSSEEIWADISDKILQTISELLNNNISNHLELIIKFMFTSLNIKQISISDKKISAFCGKTFNNLCEQRIKNFGTDLHNKCFLKIMSIYFDELKSLVKSNQLSKLSFDKLLNFNFNAFSCLHITPNEQSFVAHFISYLLIQINETLELIEQDIELKIIELINTCFDAILPFVKHEILYKNNNKIFGEIAFNFTKLSNFTLITDRNENFSVLFNDFINISRNNTEFLCIYLSLVLENSKTMQCLKRESLDMSPTLISIWCRLLVTPDMTETTTDSLSYNLSLIIDDLRHGEPIELNTNSSNIFISFLNNLMKKFFNCLPNDRMPVIQSAHKYFNEMITTSESVIKQNGISLTAIKRIYELMSSLVSIASQLLYIAHKPDCLLPKIIDSVVLPTHLPIELKLQWNPIFQKAFPSFIEGLCKLQYNGIQYLERQIRRTISFYLPQLVNRSNAFHILKDDFERRNVYNHWSKLLFETIVKNFLSKTESIPTPALIEFINEFCKSDLTNEQLFVVLGQALEIVLTVDLKSKECLFLLIRSIVNIFSEKQMEKTLIEKVFENFIESNLSNKSCLKRLFEVIKFVCECCPHLFHEFIGQISRSIESIEKKRNIGTDFILRKALQELADPKLNTF